MQILILTLALAINPAIEDRQHNWSNGRNNGSCVHACYVTLLRWQGQHRAAQQWLDTYAGGGETETTFTRKLDALGARYATTSDYNPAWLERACRLNLGCGVRLRWGNGWHFVILCDLDTRRAVILDPNNPTRYLEFERGYFLDWWAVRPWALTPVYTPVAPVPK